MSHSPGRCFNLYLLLASLFLIPLLSEAEGKLEIIEFESQTLHDNPLHDPTKRKLAVFLPSQVTNNIPLPVVYYLPGYSGSCESFIKAKDAWMSYAQKVANEVTPVILVVVDGRTHWGGSQYVNSSAQGNYADYIAKEIVAKIEDGFPMASHEHRIVAGHSSGGYGALILGMQFTNIFESIIALSPDSYFEVTHIPFVKAPSVAKMSLAEVHKLMKAGSSLPVPKDDDIVYALGLCTAYAPAGPEHPGDFEWLYTAKGAFRPEVWQRWLDHDPYVLVQRNAQAFLPSQSIYLEGSAKDEYQANIGARKIYEVIRNRPSRSTFYEPPGKHSDHKMERLQRGLAWVFNKSVQDVK